MENKRAFVTGRYVNGKTMITMADGTEISIEKLPKNEEVAAAVETPLVKEDKPAWIGIPYHEVMQYAKANREQKKAPWYKRIFTKSFWF